MREIAEMAKRRVEAQNAIRSSIENLPTGEGSDDKAVEEDEGAVPVPQIEEYMAMICDTIPCSLFFLFLSFCLTNSFCFMMMMEVN